MSSVYVPGYLGLGDSIYQRPTIRELNKLYDRVYVRTPWPEIFEDLDIYPVKPNCSLRTQRKNEDKYHGWYDIPQHAVMVNPRYSLGTYKQGMNPCQAFERTVPSTEFDFSMPTFLDEQAMEIADEWGDFAIVRPCTIRTEWSAPARNCKNGYIHDCVKILKERNIEVMQIADIDDKIEYLEGFPIDYTDSYDKGQLSPMLIASLMKLAVVTVAPVGFVLPMGIAVGAPTFNIFGGYIAPDVMTDSRMDLSNYGYAAPDPFCSCYDRTHTECQKNIPQLAHHFTNFLNKVHAPKLATH